MKNRFVYKVYLAKMKCNTISAKKTNHLDTVTFCFSISKSLRNSRIFYSFVWSLEVAVLAVAGVILNNQSGDLRNVGRDKKGKMNKSCGPLGFPFWLIVILEGKLRNGLLWFFAFALVGFGEFGTGVIFGKGAWKLIMLVFRKGTTIFSLGREVALGVGLVFWRLVLVCLVWLDSVWFCICFGLFACNGGREKELQSFSGIWFPCVPLGNALGGQFHLLLGFFVVVFRGGLAPKKTPAFQRNPLLSLDLFLKYQNTQGNGKKVLATNKF